MNLYILSLLIIITCISISQSYEKRGKPSHRSSSTTASSLDSLKNGKKLRKVCVNKRMYKQNETENQQISKIANQKAIRRKRVNRKSPKLRKKHKKTIAIANDQPIGRAMPSKTGKVKRKLVKRRKGRKRIKTEQNFNVINDKNTSILNDQRSDEEIIMKTSQSVERPRKRNILKYELNSKNQERTKKGAKRRIRKEKRHQKQRELVKPNQNLKVKVQRGTHKRFRKKKKNSKEAAAETKKTAGILNDGPEILSTNKPKGVTILDDLRKIPTFDPDNVTVIPFFNFNRKKVTGREVNAKDGTILIVDESGMYHWGENYSHAGYSELDYYRYKQQKAEQEDRERRLGKPYLPIINKFINKPRPVEHLCEEVLPDRRCKYPVDTKCLKKFNNGECAKRIVYYVAEDLKTGKKERLPPEEITYPPPPSKIEILKQEKEAYYRSHCVLNSKQCVSVYEIAYNEWDAVEGIISLHKRRMRLVGRATRPYYNEDTKQHGAVFLLEEILSEDEGHSCQFVASVFPSIKAFLAKYAENCRF